MKYLNKYNEEIKFEYEWNEECVRLQKEINKYNDLLINDEVWKNHYHRIPNYYKKQLDSEFLESIIEFGKNRIKEIDKENQELLEELKNILEDIDDYDGEYIESYELIECELGELPTKFIIQKKSTNLEKETGVSSIDFAWYLHLDINRSIKRKKLLKQMIYSSDEVTNHWTKLISLTNSIKNLGLDVNLSLLDKEIIFYIKRTDI